MIDVRFNIAFNGTHYLGVNLREDTTTPGKAEDFQAKLKAMYPEDEGYEVTVSVRPYGTSYIPYEGQTLSELMNEVSKLRLGNSHFKSRD